MARKRGTEMATDVSEIVADETIEDESEDEVKAKRERVDLETLDPNEKVMLSVSMPAGLKLAILKAGEEASKAGSIFALEVLAQRFEYALPDTFLKRTRKHKYATPEEAKEAAAKAAKAHRENVKAILAALKANPDAAANLGITLPD